MKLTRYQANPILSPDSRNAWESFVTTNPGAWYDQESKQVTLLYRAAGADAEHRIYFGMASSNNGYDFKRVSDEPVFAPSDDGFDAGCVEDPRIVRMGDYFYITYASRPFPPGHYWKRPKDKPYHPPQCPPDFPRILRDNATSSGLAITKDFKTFIRAGSLSRPTLDDRDVILFPEKINGKYVMIHRPMEWHGPEYGTEHPAMWIATGDDLLALRDEKFLAKGKYDWENGKIGGNTPPVKTQHGWLTLYHAVGRDKHYRLGAMLLDLNDPSKVLHRTPDWLIQPEKDYELDGPYNGCIFPCGKVVIDNTLFVYYGAADKYVALATCSLKQLLDHLLSCPP
jgi:predicted GH43/DUF377 family glycosyl hydrolase